MLYDLFICHASEDKESLVRPLVELLKNENIEVWYDEFSLKLGDSIRRAIDKGLSQSRFGAVVISPSFLKKQWTQYELDGLTEKEINGKQKVILPIWHDLTYKQVLEYSPSIANKKASLSENGLIQIVKEIKEVIYPQGSPLVAARDFLLDWDFVPPVVTDEYWIDVIEASNRSNSFNNIIPEESIWGRWSYPLPPKNRNSREWGERLAWTAMQLSWTRKADSIPISPLTCPEELLNFIYTETGLYETCLDFPSLTAEYAPQLTIRGFEGGFKDVFENNFKKSLLQGQKNRREKSRSGIALTIDGKSPVCDETWALRHDNFGYYKPDSIAHAYFSGGTFGPIVSPFYDADHLFWLLSKQSNWLPSKIKSYLLEGMISSTTWPWGYISEDKGGDWENNGDLSKDLFDLKEDEDKEFIWKKNLKEDVKHRINASIIELKLPESVDDLFKAFQELKISQKCLERYKNRIYR
ncbi:MAG: toll/interleukin-1 receptor domain-containing protein [Spirochaetales bacterium]|nr:toll/interleukin-1 receptor domain-containing protein [Spirochaetales bacterium]